METNMSQKPVIFDNIQRRIVEEAIKEVCEHKNFFLHAVNARTNHVHAVISAQVKPELAAELFKKYSTRKLRDLSLAERDTRLWARGRSRKYLWKQEHLTAAIDSVLYGQGDLPFEIDLKRRAP
jgi:REP element-mobilizing transposase RayT